MLVKALVLIKLHSWWWEKLGCCCSLLPSKIKFYSHFFSILLPAICERYLRELILPNCQKGDPLPLSDSSWSQIQSQDRRYSWHPFFSSQLLLQYFWFERYVSSKALVIIYLLFNIFTLSVRSQICFVGIRNGTRYMF